MDDLTQNWIKFEVIINWEVGRKRSREKGEDEDEAIKKLFEE